jgi:hypothetical protein
MSAMISGVPLKVLADAGIVTRDERGGRAYGAIVPGTAGRDQPASPFSYA